MTGEELRRVAGARGPVVELAVVEAAMRSAGLSWDEVAYLATTTIQESVKGTRFVYAENPMIGAYFAGLLVGLAEGIAADRKDFLAELERSVAAAAADPRGEAPA